jgi:hypothetical protein
MGGWHCLLLVRGLCLLNTRFAALPKIKPCFFLMKTGLWQKINHGFSLLAGAILIYVYVNLYHSLFFQVKFLAGYYFDVAGDS